MQPYCQTPPNGKQLQITFANELTHSHFNTILALTTPLELRFISHSDTVYTEP